MIVWVNKNLQQQWIYSIFSKNKWCVLSFNIILVNHKISAFYYLYDRAPHLSLTDLTLLYPFLIVYQVDTFLYISCSFRLSIKLLINAFYASYTCYSVFQQNRPGIHLDKPHWYGRMAHCLYIDCYKDRHISFQNILTGTLCKEWYGVSQISC